MIHIGIEWLQNIIPMARVRNGLHKTEQRVISAQFLFAPLALTLHLHSRRMAHFNPDIVAHIEELKQKVPRTFVFSVGVPAPRPEHVEEEDYLNQLLRRLPADTTVTPIQAEASDQPMDVVDEPSQSAMDPAVLQVLFNVVVAAKQAEKAEIRRLKKNESAKRSRQRQKAGLPPLRRRPKIQSVVEEH